MNAGTGPAEGGPDNRVLVITQSKGSLLETLPVSRMLVQDRSMRPLYLVQAKHADFMLPVLAEERLEALKPSGKPFMPAAGETATPGSSKPRTLRRRVFPRLPEFVRLLVHHRAQLKTARRILGRHPEIRTLLVMGDRNVGYETAFVRAANDRGIPSLILPFASSFPEAIAETRLREKEFRRKYAVSGPCRALLAWLFPRWIYRHKEQRMFYRPPANSLAAWWFGMMSSNPWTLGGGAATRMTVDSEESLEMFVKQGMVPGKMVVTGRPSADEITRTLRNVEPGSIRKELGIPDGRRIILCSVPQLAENGLLPWDQHWEEMGFLFSTMVAEDAAVVLSLHPKSDPEKYRPHADRLGAILATRRIYELMPVCDVLVASLSSVVAPAIALHKPSVVVDFYGLGYSLYDSAPGVTVVRERKDFAPILHSLLTDPGCYEGMRKRQEAEGHRWAMLDGECTRRVKEELMRLV
ncbi:MAG: CDP-glycerol glycerophosphotransferase family protein, partial [Planctomycetes bacterium]|nr:CDP-glycerol glycerophosphotransferase family protein [Planctomycetota bacterium]